MSSNLMSRGPIGCMRREAGKSKRRLSERRLCVMYHTADETSKWEIGRRCFGREFASAKAQGVLRFGSAAPCDSERAGSEAFDLVKWLGGGFVRKLLKMRGKFRERSFQAISMS